MNSNREYIHGYCSPCKRFFNSFFSLSSIKLQQTSAGKKPAPPPNYNKPNHQTQHHHQTSQPSTKKIPKSTETQKSTKPKINRNPKYTQSLQLNTTPTTQTHRKPIGKTHMKNPTKTHVKNPTENPLDLPRFATDLPPICSCGSGLRIGRAVDRYL